MHRTLLSVIPLLAACEATEVFVDGDPAVCGTLTETWTPADELPEDVDLRETWRNRGTGITDVQWVDGENDLFAVITTVNADEALTRSFENSEREGCETTWWAEVNWEGEARSGRLDVQLRSLVPAGATLLRLTAELPEDTARDLFVDVDPDATVPAVLTATITGDRLSTVQLVAQDEDGEELVVMGSE